MIDVFDRRVSWTRLLASIKSWWSAKRVVGSQNLDGFTYQYYNNTVRLSYMLTNATLKTCLQIKCVPIVEYVFCLSELMVLRLSTKIACDRKLTKLV